jgi:DNA-binding response OmpR family regulator
MAATKKVLCIEDDAFLSGLVSGKLVENGFTVSTAIGGLPGIEMAKSEHPDLVLLDIMLPDLGGFEVLQKLKADPATANVPVVILSNLGGREEMEKGISLGAAGYLIKSNILPQEVAELIQQLVGTPAPIPPQAAVAQAA